MSNTQATDAPERVPATAAQLKAEFSDSSAEFRMEQLEKGATIAEAHKAYSIYLQEQLGKEKAAREEAEKKVADAEAKASKAQPATKVSQVRGNKPTPTAEADGESAGDVRDQYAELIQKKMAGGLSREKAARAVGLEYPHLRAALVAQANS